MLCREAAKIVGDKPPADWTKAEIRAVVAANVAAMESFITQTKEPIQQLEGA